MSKTLEGIWRDDEHKLLLKLCDEKLVNDDSTVRVSAMAWVMERKDDRPVLGALLISVMPKYNNRMLVTSSVEQCPGVYYITVVKA